MDDSERALLVAEDAGAVVGMAECFVMKSPSFPVIQDRTWVQLDGIAVRQNYQNQNVGSALLAAVKE